jgi:hypothetical protein
MKRTASPDALGAPWYAAKALAAAAAEKREKSSSGTGEISVEEWVLDLGSRRSRRETACG